MILRNGWLPGLHVKMNMNGFRAPTMSALKVQCDKDDGVFECYRRENNGFTQIHSGNYARNPNSPLRTSISVLFAHYVTKTHVTGCVSVTNEKHK